MESTPLTAISGRTIVVVPVYNHAGTLRSVVEGVLAYHPHVLVVDDGSTDIAGANNVSVVCNTTLPQGVSVADFPENHPLRGLAVGYIRHSVNKGKGEAIRSAAKEAARLGATHMVTIDADGQHNPADIPRFLEVAAVNPVNILVGVRDFTVANVPFSSRFGRWFSNFWFKVQTGAVLGDTQSGFRLYPLAVLDRVACTDSRYSFEIEILVRSAWAGFTARDVPIGVHYPPKSQRVSHFHAVLDNLRLTWLNTRLTIRAITPVPHKTYETDGEGKITALRPLRSLRVLLARNETPGNLALSASLGMALGTLPLIGIHSISILVAAGALRLNKIAALAVSQLCMPPFVPALCIEAGHYLRYGRFLTEISLRTLGYEALDRVWEWVLGSLVLAPLFALVIGCFVFFLAKIVQVGLRDEDGQGGTDGRA
ncbi:MAG: hypothetical protein DELT_00701 [Desulfovibrio sp.]